MSSPTTPDSLIYVMLEQPKANRFSQHAINKLVLMLNLMGLLLSIQAFLHLLQSNPCPDA
jgi:CHASE1-domain containing sensor protein